MQENQNQYPKTFMVGDTPYVAKNLEDEIRIIKMIKMKEGQMQA